MTSNHKNNHTIRFIGPNNPLYHISYVYISITIFEGGFNQIEKRFLPPRPQKKVEKFEPYFFLNIYIVKMRKLQKNQFLHSNPARIHIYTHCWSWLDIWWAIQLLWSCDSPIRCWISPCRSTTIDPMWLCFRQTMSKCKM